jgi:hypothetical protein
MIQATGIITSKDGVTEFKNALINVCLNANSKFEPTSGIAQVGKIIEVNGSSKFEGVCNIGVYEYNLPNPSFNDVQNCVLEGLKKDYPSVTFKIV